MPSLVMAEQSPRRSCSSAHHLGQASSRAGAATRSPRPGPPGGRASSRAGAATHHLSQASSRAGFLDWRAPPVASQRKPHKCIQNHRRTRPARLANPLQHKMHRPGQRPRRNPKTASRPSATLCTECSYAAPQAHMRRAMRASVGAAQLPSRSRSAADTARAFSAMPANSATTATPARRGCTP